MKKPNAMLAAIEARADAKYRAKYNLQLYVLRQMCFDAAFMAAADVFRMGPGRCEAFGLSMNGYIDSMAEMIHEDARNDPDLDYTRAKVDRRLEKICGEKFEPWEVRYGAEDGN